MRIVTWNINSLRLRIETLGRVVGELKPDIVCLQETKVQDQDFPSDKVRELGFQHVIFRGMKSYNGVAILSHVPIKEVRSKTWCAREDCRHIAAKLPGGEELHNFYVPAGGDIPNPEQNDKFAHKLAFIDEMADWFGKKRQAKRILVGDLNIAPFENDVWSHKQLLKIVSHTPVEVEGLTRVMAAHDWIDAVREIIPPSEQLYSWWSYRNRTWPGSDRGRRLDHVWITPGLRGALRDAHVFRDARGWERPSDHAPVAVDLDI
ncbi:MAG: exodeoxyribonuclease III [Alphaproteobacteria bacterium]